MSERPTYSFSARISGTSSDGRIERSDGAAVQITEAELPDLFLDLAADGSTGMPGRPKYHRLVLEEWFARKTAARKPNLSLVG